MKMNVTFDGLGSFNDLKPCKHVLARLMCHRVFWEEDPLDVWGYLGFRPKGEMMENGLDIMFRDQKVGVIEPMDDASSKAFIDSLKWVNQPKWCADLSEEREQAKRSLTPRRSRIPRWMKILAPIAMVIGIVCFW